MSDDKSNSRDQRKSYTCSFKLQVVEFAESYSNSKAAEEFGVHRRRVQEWKNQKHRLVEQVKNFNGSTKRLKGGGRRKIHSTKERDIDHENVLADHLISLLNENEISLNKDLVLREAKLIDPDFTGGSKWATAFLDRLVARINREKDKKVSVSAELEDIEIDHYFDQVAKDEMRIVRHLEKKLLNFIDRCPDRIMLSELVYREAKKQANLFEVTPVWVSEFLDLHRQFIRENKRRYLHSESPPPRFNDAEEFGAHRAEAPFLFSRHENFMKQESFENENEKEFKQKLFINEHGEEYFEGNPSKRKRIFDAFRDTSLTIHEWFDRHAEYVQE